MVLIANKQARMKEIVGHTSLYKMLKHLEYPEAASGSEVTTVREVWSSD